MAKISDYLEAGDLIVASATWQRCQVVATRRGMVIGVVALDYGNKLDCIHLASVEQFLLGEDLVAITPMNSWLLMVGQRGSAFILEGIIDRPHTLRVKRVMENR